MKTWHAAASMLLLCAAPALGQAPTAAQKQATVAWIQSCQKKAGGFAVNPGKDAPATLGATTAAVRALKYFGGKLHNREGCVRFVLSCYDKVETGFAPRPGGKTDPLTTAVGLLAVKDLNIEDAEYHVKPVIYLCAHVKTFDEMRLAAAAYEALGSKCELADNWIAAIARKRNADGTFGKGPGAARETAGAVVTLLRLGAPLEHRSSVLKTIQMGQLADGAWGKDDQGSDLETTYRVVRALVMLKAHPRDLQACRDFIARCRQADGSYAVRPGGPGAVNATYYAGIVLHWLDRGR